MSAFDPVPAATLLAEAMNTGRRFSELPEAARPLSIADGYDVQDAIAAGRGGLKDTTAGWKLGLGSANAMRAAKLTRPLIGRVYKGRLYPSDATVPAPAGAKALIEIEIAFTLGRDVPPTQTPGDPLSSVSRTSLVSEIVISRFIDRTVVGLPSFAADSVGFHALVIGPDVKPSDIATVTRSLAVTCNGAEATTVATGDDAIDPVEMLGHLMAHARERGITLKAGEIVTTGTLSKPFEATVPCAIAATTGLGAVRYRLA